MGKKIDAGELELIKGKEQLMLVRVERSVCAIGAAFFSLLSIVLGFFWRRSLARILMHTDT